MKHIFIFCLLAVQWRMAMADYIPFVVEGKTWGLESFLPISTDVLPLTLILSGDTLINDTTYKKLLFDGRYEGAYREENHKVYAIWAGMAKEKKLYDFDLEVGDKYIEYDFYGNPHTYEVCLNDSFYNHGHMLHRIGMGFPANYESASFPENIWIEGVGSERGPTSSIYFTHTGNGVRIRYCRVGDDFLYKDTLQEFVSKNLAWADGFTQDGSVRLNRHQATGTREVDGRTYIIMNARQYAAQPQGGVSAGGVVEYLLREDADGEAWLRMECPQQVTSLYGVILDDETAARLAGRDLYLFNTRASGWNYMTYGHLVPSDGKEENWQTEKAKVKQNSNTFVVLENNNYTFQRSLEGAGIPPFLMSVGWQGYGPLYGLGNPTGGTRFFPILYEGKRTVYQDEECLAFLRAKASPLMDILTDIKPVTYTAGQMATIILPTSPDAGKGKYYRLDRVEGSEVIFEQELQPQAHMPYIIVPGEDFSIDLSTLDLAGLGNDTVSIEGISFIGTYVGEVLPSFGGDGGGSFYIDIIDTTPDCGFMAEAGKGAVVGALRAWLHVTWNDPYNQGGTKAPGEKLQIGLKDKGTPIESPREEMVNGKCFDLSGRRLPGKPKSGLYIDEGRKRVR